MKIVNCISLDNQPCLARPTLVELNFDKLRCHPFINNLDKCPGSFNILNTLWNPRISA